MSGQSNTFYSRFADGSDNALPAFSLRRIIGQTFLAFNLLLVLALYNSANPQNSSPANSNTPSAVTREFE